MLVAEYDYELDIEVQREEAEQLGYERGLKRGVQYNIISSIMKKWKARQDAVTISEDLLEELEYVQKVCKIAQQHPDATPEDIYKEIYKGKESI